jgi:hypothetical protein
MDHQDPDKRGTDMKKALLGTLASFSLLTSAAMAHDDACSFSFDHDLSVIDNAITISHSSTETIYIDNNNQLFINDEIQVLSGEQQQLIDQYADNIRLLIPEVTAIAIEGIGLGMDAASLALGTLFGEYDPDYLEFTQRISELGDKIILKLDTSNFDSKALEKAFDEEFEREIETFVEQTVEELTPRLMAKMMTAALAGEGGESDLEMRANQIEHEITAFVEPRAEALEQRANELCGIIEQLDTIETQMVATGMDKMDLIKTDGKGDINLKGLDKLKNKNFNLNLGH